MAGILDDIQKEALDQKISVSTLLRKVKVAAAKLRLAKVEEWVDKELKGYSGEDEVPSYRKISGAPIAKGFYGGWEPIHFETDGEKFSRVPIGQSIPAMEAQLKAQGPKTLLIFPYPEKIKAMLAKGNNRQIAQCGVRFEASALEGITEAVRTLVLEWAIEVSKTGVSDTDKDFSESDRKKAAGVTIQIGSIGTFTGNLGVGNASADITSSSPLSLEEVGKLLTQIKTLAVEATREGVNEDELLRRIADIEAEVKKPAPNHGVIRTMLHGLQGIFIHAAGGVVAAGVIATLNQLLGTGVPSPG
jgi:hypothetical protein